MKKSYATLFRSRAKQAGFTLIELSVVSIVLVVLAVLANKALIDNLNEANAEATGSYFSTLKSSMEDYATKNITQLANNVAVTGFVNPLSPTMAELKLAGHLASAYPAQSQLQQSVTFTVTRSAACPGAGCLVSSYVVANSPIAVTDANNGYLAAIVRNKTGGYGIGSTESNASQLTGVQCDPIANPLGAVANVMGACSVVNGGFYSQFVRRGDDRPTVLNNTLTVIGTVTASSIVATGSIASLTGSVGAGTGGTGCRLAEILASGQIVSRTADCITRVFVESTVADGGQLRLMNPANQQTVQIRGASGQILAGNGAATTVTVDGAGGNITTNGLSTSSRPVGQTGGLSTQDVAARGELAAWDGTISRATVGSDGQISARDAAGLSTAFLDGSSGKATAQTLLATSFGTVGAACPTIGDQRQRTGAPGAYVTCQGGVWVALGSRVVAANSSCTVAGESAIDTSGQMMVCKQAGGGPGGFFVPAKNMFSDFVFLASSFVTDGSVVTKPVCAAFSGSTGLPLIFVIGQTEGTPDGALNRYAVDNGGSWTIRLKSGNDTSSLVGASALAQQYCFYSS